MTSTPFLAFAVLALVAQSASPTFERRAAALKQMGRPIQFDALAGVGHYEMGGYLAALRNGGRWVREQWQK